MEREVFCSAKFPGAPLATIKALARLSLSDFGGRAEHDFGDESFSCVLRAVPLLVEDLLRQVKSEKKWGDVVDERRMCHSFPHETDRLCSADCGHSLYFVHAIGCN